MTATRKWMIVAVGTALVILLSPIAYTALSARGTNGYFEGGRCACGRDTFIRIEGNSYFQYSPGHGVPEHRTFALRPRDGEWDVLGLRPPEGSWSPVAEGQVVARLRYQDGALYEAWSGTNWIRHARVNSPYRIWIAKLLFK